MTQGRKSTISDTTAKGLLELYISKEGVSITLEDRPEGRYAITIDGVNAEELDEVIRCGLGKWIDVFEPLTP